MARSVIHASLWRLAAAAVAVFALTVGTARASAVTVASAEAQLFTLLNNARGAEGRAALARDPGLDGLAREWSTQMAATDDFSHRPDLAARIAQIEPLRRSWAENIAWRSAGGALADSDVTLVHTGLMNSPNHYTNIMGNFNRVGVGVHLVGREIWVTFNFLNGPALGTPAPAPAPAPGTASPPKAPAVPAATPPTTAPAPSAAPVGRFRVQRHNARYVRVSGWAIDPDTTNPIRVRVRVAGRERVHLAARDRRDVARWFPAHGSRHGFSFLSRAGATARVCVTALDAESGANRQLGCRRAPR